MSNLNFVCLTIFVSDRRFSFLFPSEKTQFLFPEECQYLLIIHCLGLLRTYMPNINFKHLHSDLPDAFAHATLDIHENNTFAPLS
jgi:hypothetical protein